MERAEAERDKVGAKKLSEEEMDTTGHGDKLQAAVDKVADPSDDGATEPPTQIAEEEMDTSGHGDPKRHLLSSNQ